MDANHKVGESMRCARRASCRVLLGCVAVAGSAYGAPALNWLDIEGRIQYAYFTQDIRAEQSVLGVLTASEDPDRARNYYRGLAAYRLALLERARDAAAVSAAAGQCVAALDTVLKMQRDDADALALHAACLELQAGLGTWRAPLAATRSGAEGERARQLAPHNPRALLLAAVADYEHAKPGTQARAQALDSLRKAAAAFEDERQQPEHTPEWGAAEVYVYLARGYLERGTALEARDALERALLLAPEYLEARQLMAKLTS